MIGYNHGMTTYARGKKWAEAGEGINETRNSLVREDRQFRLVADFGMTGDQPGAVARLSESVQNGMNRQSLMGVTGSGKTFTMANIVQQVQRPTLVMAHNKTLAAQLASEFKEFFPHNAVEYFVSYYDYYQPEAYVPQSDTYIEKDSSVNEELDKLRLSATTSLLTRRDVLIVASVSCIYGLGDPIDYFNLVAQVKVGEIRNRSQLVRQLVDMQYERNDLDLKPCQVSRSRRRFGARAGLRRSGGARPVLRRRGGTYRPIGPADRRGACRPAASVNLPGEPLRYVQGETGAGGPRHQSRVGTAPQAPPGQRQNT